MTALHDRSARTPSFSIDFTIREDVISLHGELTVTSAPTLEATIELIDGTRETLVLDLADLRFVDSSGLNQLVNLHLRLAANGGHLALRDPRPNVRKLLVLNGLDTVLSVEPAARPGSVGPFAG